MAGVTRIKALKIFTIVLGTVILGVGLDSNFNLSWTKALPLPDGNTIKPHRTCILLTLMQPVPCPSMAMEHYYISAIIICLILSLLGLAASYLGQAYCGSGPWKTIDFSFHAVAAMLLFAVGLVYIISAHQIHALFGTDVELEKLGVSDWRRTEKLIAGALTILQAFIYGFVAVVIGRE